MAVLPGRDPYRGFKFAGDRWSFRKVDDQVIPLLDGRAIPCLRSIVVESSPVDLTVMTLTVTVAPDRDGE